MKVTLISPKRVGGFSNISFLRFPPQALVQLASMTPLSWELEVVDENLGEIPFDKPTDLAAVSSITATAPRAYEIIHEYQKRYVPCVMGGIHASMLPGEASRFADSVVVGEAENVWPQLLRDFSGGELKPRYVCPTPESLDFQPLRQVSRTFEVSVLGRRVCNAFFQTQRGCPFGCDFCSVRDFNGSVVRSRAIARVVEQIDAEKSSNPYYVCFVDDNLIANPAYARQLFRAIRPLGIRWLSQMDIRIAGDESGGGTDDLLDLACESGMQAVMFGLESVSGEVLKRFGGPKAVWRKRYESAIKMLRARGILVYATFILGFDGEPSDTAETTVKWAIDHGVSFADFCILTPLPGTEFFRSMRSEGRILTYDWSKYDTHHCVFRPFGRDPKEIEDQMIRANSRFYSISSIFARANAKVPLANQAAYLATNWQFRNYF